jgi:hypothetical protein
MSSCADKVIAFAVGDSGRSVGMSRKVWSSAIRLCGLCGTIFS